MIGHDSNVTRKSPKMMRHESNEIKVTMDDKPWFECNENSVGRLFMIRIPGFPSRFIIPWSCMAPYKTYNFFLWSHRYESGFRVWSAWIYISIIQFRIINGPDSMRNSNHKFLLPTRVVNLEKTCKSWDPPALWAECIIGNNATFDLPYLRTIHCRSQQSPIIQRKLPKIDDFDLFSVLWLSWHFCWGISSNFISVCVNWLR